MKLLFEYTLDYIKRNRRGSIAIMVAILMTATMLSAMCGLLYNVYTDSVSYVLAKTGNWHGELFDDTLGSDLLIIKATEAFQNVETMMIKGDWKIAKIDDPRRDYLTWRDTNAEYWNSMPEGTSAILEGRTPTQSGEVALSKQYFEHHPEVKIGSEITLPFGNRIAADSSIIAPQNTTQPGEHFVQTGMVTLKVVGKLDITTSSTVPSYYALGFLEPENILPDDKLTIYFRFHNVRDTYKELPKIAKAVGYRQDEYGNYLLRYNTAYLVRIGVLSPEQTGQMMNLLLANQVPLTVAITGLLVAALFVLIIHNAFVLSSTTRLSQLGIFASVGATPKQIKRSVIWEAFLLTALPLPIGLAIGQIVVGLFINLANQDNRNSMLFTVGWQSLLPSILLTIFTVWWSALIPARKISRMSPIDAIRQGEIKKYKKHKKQSRFSISKLGGVFGISGELAANALQARKKSYYTATISLTLSFLTLASFLCINSTSTASMEIYKTDEKRWEDQDILLTLYHVATPEDYDIITKSVGDLDKVTSARWYSTLRTAAWIPEDGFSDEFYKSGDFAAVEKKLFGAQIPLLRDGKRRVSTILFGIDDASFSEYCASLGIDPAVFYKEDSYRGILYHMVNDITASTRRNPVSIPFLDISQGDLLTLTETTNDSYEGDFTFDTEVVAIADHLPPLGNTIFGVRYSTVQVMPISRVSKLAANFARNSAVQVESVIQVTDPAQIAPTRTATEQVCESYFGSGDYEVYDENEYYELKESGKVVTTVLFGFIVAVLAVIGLSNAWSTVRGTLNARRREFAMLRSVGLPPKGVRHMLLLEAVMLGLTPVLLSLPVVIVVESMFLSINEITFMEWLPFAPFLPILIYVTALLCATATAYATGANAILRENIIEAVKMDSM